MMFRANGNNGNIKKFSLILAVCVVAVLGISVLVILTKYDFDIQSAMGGDSVSQTQSDEAESVQEQIIADKTCLFWVLNSEKTHLRFVWLVNIRLPERKISVCTLAPSSFIEFEGKSMSIEQVYLKYGKNKFVSALEADTGIKIDGYIGSYDESFKTMINYIGGASITIPEQIEYRGDEFALILVKGKQNIKGDTLLKYLIYLDTLGERGGNYQASVIAEVFESVFKPSFSEKGEKVFSKISNTLITNFTIVDYSGAKEAIEFLTENGFKVKRAVDTPKELKE